MKSPAPATILKARNNAGQTQTQAAETIFRSLRAWQQWEGGQRSMAPDSFRLYLIDTNQNMRPWRV